MKKIEKPAKGEFPAYAGIYIDLIPDDGLVLQHLDENLKIVKYLVLSLSGEKLTHRYEKNKWTIPEILVHVIDDERIYAYRALRFARNDRTDLPGFEQDDYVFYSDANNRNIESILEEYETVRKATISLFNNLPEDALMRTGIANHHKVSVRALVYHIAGHELHHLNIIREKYLKAPL